MAVTLDNQQYGVSDAATTTVGITVANNTNRLLLALISMGSSTGVSQVDSVTFNTTETFTRAGTIQDNASDSACDVWYRIAPTATTANVVVDYAGSASPDAAVNVVSLYDVDQADPIGARGGGNGTDDHPTVSTTTEVAGGWIVGVVSKENSGTGASSTPDANTNEWRDSIGGSGAGDYLHLSGYRDAPLASTAYSMGWTHTTGADPWAMLCFEIKTAGLATPSPNISDSITVAEGPSGGLPNIALVDNVVPHGGTGDAAVIPGWKRGIRIYTP